MIAVLMAPGPTNALLASSAHQQGTAKTNLLIPAEFFGYFYAINLWAFADSSDCAGLVNLIHLRIFSA